MSGFSALLGERTLEEEWASFKAGRRSVANTRHRTGDVGRELASTPRSRNAEFLRELENLAAALRSRSPRDRPWRSRAPKRSITPVFDAYRRRLDDLSLSEEGTGTSDVSSPSDLSDITSSDMSELSPPRWRRLKVRKRADCRHNHDAYERKAEVLRNLESVSQSPDAHLIRSQSKQPRSPKLSVVRNYIGSEERPAKGENFDADTDEEIDEVDEMEALQLRHAFHLNGVDLLEGGDVANPLQGRLRATEDAHFFEEHGLNEHKRLHKEGSSQKPFDIPAASELRAECTVKREGKKPQVDGRGTSVRSRSSASISRQVTVPSDTHFPPTPTYPPPPVPKRHVSPPPVPDETPSRELNSTAGHETEDSVPDSDDVLGGLRRQAVERRQKRPITPLHTKGGEITHGLEKAGISVKKEVSFHRTRTERVAEGKPRKKEKSRRFSFMKGSGEEGEVKHPPHDIRSDAGGSPPGSLDRSVGMKDVHLPPRRKKNGWLVSAALRKFVGDSTMGITSWSKNKKSALKEVGAAKKKRSNIFRKGLSESKAAGTVTSRPVIGRAVLKSAELDKV